MIIRIDDPRAQHPRRPTPVPVEFAGQWVAWDRHRTRVVAHGKELAQVQQATVAQGVEDAIFQKVPPADGFYIGAS